MIEILKKICVKTTIIVVENREPYYFIIICKCKAVPLSLFTYSILASTLTTDEQSIYCKVYGLHKWTHTHTHARTHAHNFSTKGGSEFS